MGDEGTGFIDRLPDGMVDDFVNRCCVGETPLEFVVNAHGELIMTNHARDTFAVVGMSGDGGSQACFTHVYYDPLSVMDPDGAPVSTSDHGSPEEAFSAAVSALGHDFPAAPSP